MYVCTGRPWRPTPPPTSAEGRGGGRGGTGGPPRPSAEMGGRGGGGGDWPPGAAPYTRTSAQVPSLFKGMYVYINVRVYIQMYVCL